ncbi:MAG: lamin tail domain-containing protein, partial [Akkermansiaceae bacterium]
IEVANRGLTPVNLGGWDFGDGVSFEFPANTMLASGEHACIARNAVEFTAAFPGARLLGEFDGNLSRRGERLLLRDAAKNPADELRYYDSGHWSDLPDGGGATLELRDLEADNTVGEAWAASEETAQTAWKTYRYSGTVSSSAGPDSKWREFNMGLLSDGEILIDDLSVLENGSTQKLSNTTFSSGSSSWRFRGTHRHSEIIDDPDSPGNKVLRLVASGGTGHMHNQIETTLLSSVANGQNYEISFRARWVSGSNQLHTRLYFNRLPGVTIIDRPAHVGTPSAPNSRAESNIGPTLSALRHSPVVPAVNQAVRVSVGAGDPDLVAGMILYYSVGGGGFQSIAMSGGAGGRYQAVIPGQSAGSVVQFYVAATDGLGASSMFPARGPDSRALYKVEDGLAATNGQHNFRIVVTDAERDFIHSSIEVMSNDRIGATIIDREEDIYYDVKLRLKGSERARSQNNRVGYNMRFGADDLYRGIHKSLAIDRSEGVGQGQIEILFDFMIANSGGVVSRYYDFIKVLAPKNGHTRSAVLQMARYDDVFLNSQFENGSDGSLYEYELLYTPNNADGNGYKLPQPDGVTGASVSDKGDNKEKYRWFFLKKNNRDADDFAPIIDYNKKFSQSGAAFESGLEEVVDVDGWLRGMAYAVLSGAGDNAGANSQHNGMYYAHPDGRVMFLPHDMDFSFSTSRSIFANSQCSKLTADGKRKRIYLGHLHDIISTTYNNSYMSMWTTHLASLDSSQNWSSHLSYVTNRSNNVLSQINGQISPIAFSITTSSPFSVAGSVATVSGDGWVNVREILVAGTNTPLVVTWVDGNSWQVTLPVAPGSQSYTLQAYDFSGALVGGGSVTIENTTAVEPASAGNLAISEFMYHPAAPTASEVAAGFTDDDLFEYLELMNIGAAPVDLTGVAFSGAFDFLLPSTIIAPGARVVLARDRSAFLTRHPGSAGALLDGEYYGAGDTNQLSNGGEQIVLRSALGGDIRRFTYDDDPDWPTSPDGGGYSLVLIAPVSNPLHGDPFSWRPATVSGGNPGTTDAAPPFAGDPDLDQDADGISALLEHAYGTSDSSPGPDDSHALGIGVFDDGSGTLREYLTITFRRNLAADDLVFDAEASTDLVAWSVLDTAYLSAVHNGDGTETVTYRSTTPLASIPREFIRLRVSTR